MDTILNHTCNFRVDRRFQIIVTDMVIYGLTFLMLICNVVFFCKGPRTVLGFWSTQMLLASSQ